MTDLQNSSSQNTFVQNPFLQNPFLQPTKQELLQRDLTEFLENVKIPGHEYVAQHALSFYYNFLQTKDYKSIIKMMNGIPSDFLNVNTFEPMLYCLHDHYDIDLYRCVFNKMPKQTLGMKDKIGKTFLHYFLAYVNDVSLVNFVFSYLNEEKKIRQENLFCKLLFMRDDQENTAFSCLAGNTSFEVCTFSYDFISHCLPLSVIMGIKNIHDQPFSFGLCHNTNLEVVRFFCKESGEDFSRPDKYGNTLLFYMMGNDSLEVLKYCLDRPRKTLRLQNNNGDTLLHFLVLNNPHFKNIEYVLNQKSLQFLLTFENDQEETILSHAERTKPAIMKLVIDKFSEFPHLKSQVSYLNGIYQKRKNFSF